MGLSSVQHGLRFSKSCREIFRVLAGGIVPRWIPAGGLYAKIVIAAQKSGTATMAPSNIVRTPGARTV
jgi:hypothetical protein